MYISINGKYYYSIIIPFAVLYRCVLTTKRVDIDINMFFSPAKTCARTAGFYKPAFFIYSLADRGQVCEKSTGTRNLFDKILAILRFYSKLPYTKIAAIRWSCNKCSQSPLNALNNYDIKNSDVLALSGRLLAVNTT